MIHRIEIPDWANSVIQTLMRALRERDPYTYGHCRRVAYHARLLAKAAGLSEKDQYTTELSSIFHDLGKLGIPDTVLLKPGRLNAHEEAIMRTHPVKSQEILMPLSHIPIFNSVIPGVRSHHERIDGLGYPDGVTGDKIPLTSRIILIADTFDAMTTTRPYRRGMSNEIAYNELKLFAGRQFDSKLVNIFLKAHPHWGNIEEEVTEEFTYSGTKKAA